MIPEIDDATAARLANDILGTSTASVQAIETGFANRNWRVRVSGRDYVLKVGPGTSAPKWTSAAHGLAIARELGISVPTTRFQQVVDGRYVRLLDWVHGSSARSLQGAPTKQRRLGEHLGLAVAALHEHELEWFGSRLDGSAATFSTWHDYVHHRLDQIQVRAATNGAPHAELLDQARQVVCDVLPQASRACRAVVCHRDLHADNLIVDAAGNLIAIIDWDMPEAWDAAGEWFKLETMLFADLPDSRAAFEAAYFEVHSHEAKWEKRTWIVKVIENMNVIANAANHASDFTDSAITRLQSLL